MDRLFCMIALCALLAHVPALQDAGAQRAARPVFFSMIFPQLVPSFLLDGTQEEEIRL